MTTTAENANEDSKNSGDEVTGDNDESNNETTEAARVVQVQGLPLDWTQINAAAGTERPIRYPSDVAEIDIADDELCIVGTAGQKITNMGPDFSGTVNPALRSLILRSHVIRKLEGLEHFTCLELLELYDNQVESLSSCLDTNQGRPGVTLRVLDMSYNCIRDMDPVAHCPNLQELYLANNKIKAMTGLSGLSQLKKLDLGANRIREMKVEELSGLTNVVDLWLGKNKIEMIEGLESLTKLRRLDVQSNRLTTVENLGSQRETLEELYLSHNAVTTEGASIPTGLAQEFSQLTVLDLSRNQLTKCDPFGHLTTLEELWISGNTIQSFDDIQSLSNLKLETVYLEYNPLQKAEPLYRKKLAELIPSLKQIDANLIVGYESRGATHYVSPRTLGTDEEALRRLQDIAIARAQVESEGAAST